ncbi:helix-turn-helix domain-containing protein [Streptomyces sp. NPDC001584]|uniref:helix-turn-helix domain-containing protein n=1 Tax=Streptomyces sp. NPDC001584 TaxID=3154521 RepID=UPI00332484B4
MGTGDDQVRDVGRELGPGFGVGEGYAWYRGVSPGGSVHRHAAFQLVLAPRGEAVLAGADGGIVRGAALLVPPMTAHRMLSAGDLLTVFVEPHSALADRLRGRCGSGSGIVAVPELRRLDEAELDRAAALPSAGLDPRLLAASALLEGPEGVEERVPMDVVAARVGLSPQRLRALARQQLGMPLARRRIWLKLRRSAEALGEGRSPAEAAAAGGFADQAHLTHRMREMIGMTPAAVLRVLPASAAGAPGDVHRNGPGDG